MRWLRKARRAAEARISSFLLGFLGGFGCVVALSLVLGVLASRLSVPHPTAALFESLAQIGAALFVAFAVTLAAVQRGSFDARSGR